jgi:hypothetical protein
MTKQAYRVEIRWSVQLRTHSGREISRAESLRRSFLLNTAKLDELDASHILAIDPEYCPILPVSQEKNGSKPDTPMYQGGGVIKGVSSEQRVP